MSKSVQVILSVFTGIIIGGVAASYFAQDISGYLGLSAKPEQTESGSKKKEPLYWVAPMDPNYRRDKPGKSPMGMDLIPVYEEDASGDSSGPGTIKISPDVVNNLGVRTAAAEQDVLNESIQTVGYVKYDEDRLIHIHPRVEGWIEKLYIKASGDPVRNGEPIYDIYSPALVNAQEEFLNAIDRKATRLITASEDRLRSLRVPEKTIRQLKNTRKVSQTVTFYAPQSGVVDNLDIRQGFYVKPGSTIMSIGILDQVWVEAEVFERQSSFVKEDLPVTMTLDYLPGQEWQGVVDYVYPTIDPKTRTVRVRLRFENKDHLLKPNMFAQVAIHAESSQKTLLVPREAVIRSGHSDRVVLALGEGRFKSINVKVGRYDDTSAEILSGLVEGEKVVTSAQFLLDSESSKTSDFKRLNHETKAPPASVWANATINSMMPEHRMVNVTHQKIDPWNWPEMTMDFKVAKEVDFSLLHEGMELSVEITKIKENQYEITKIYIPGSDDKKSLNDLSLDDMSLDDMSLDSGDKSDDHK